MWRSWGACNGRVLWPSCGAELPTTQTGGKACLHALQTLARQPVLAECASASADCTAARALAHSRLRECGYEVTKRALERPERALHLQALQAYLARARPPAQDPGGAAAAAKHVPPLHRPPYVRGAEHGGLGESALAADAVHWACRPLGTFAAAARRTVAQEQEDLARARDGCVLRARPRDRLLERRRS